MSTHRKLMTGCAVAVLAFGLAACGSSDDDDGPSTGMMPMGTPVAFADLEMGQTVEAGTYAVSDPSVAFLAAIEDFELPEGGYAPGAMESVGGLDFTCDADSAANCNVVVNEDGSITTTGTIQVAMTAPPVPEPTEIEKAQTAAAAAATAAMTAAGNAMTSADDADTARTNAATMQTGETSSGLATKAREQAALAHAAYMDAKTASDAAAAAGDITAAVRAQVDAENALADAMAAETKAGEYGQKAADAAGDELKIDDKTKTVGGTEIVIDGVARSKTTDGETVETGLIARMNPDHDVVAVTGEAGDADADPNPIAYKQAVAAAPGIETGFVYDSSDDKARLMLITSYAGTNMVRVYNAGTDPETGTKAGYISIDDPATNDVNEADTDANNVRLRSAGTYYPATGGTPGMLEATNEVAVDAKGKEVFSYTDPVDDTKKYVVRTTTTTGDETTTYNYFNVDVTADHDGDGTGEEATPQTGVMAGIPEKTAYDHIHFGVWASLAAAADDGTHGINSLGIGFVQSIGDGVTGDDMPNHGTATYDGDWAAAVQAADPDGNGGIRLQNGPASMEANFGMGKVTATLSNLAVLEGAIAGGTFSGTKASVHDTDASTTAIDNGSGLNTSADAKFTGTFSGAFYGAKAPEAGGVFDFVSQDNEDGAFRGAFGGAR